jgi:hypothetical protein
LRHQWPPEGHIDRHTNFRFSCQISGLPFNFLLFIGRRKQSEMEQRQFSLKKRRRFIVQKSETLRSAVMGLVPIVANVAKQQSVANVAEVAVVANVKKCSKAANVAEIAKVVK